MWFDLVSIRIRTCGKELQAEIPDIPMQIAIGMAEELVEPGELWP